MRVIESSGVPKRKRKACRKEVKKTLKRIGWAPPRPDGLRGDDVTKMWLANQCANCRKCPKLSGKLAKWREDVLAAE